MLQHWRNADQKAPPCQWLLCKYHLLLLPKHWKWFHCFHPLVGTEKDTVTHCQQRLRNSVEMFSRHMLSTLMFWDTSPEPGQKSSPLPGWVSSPPRDQADPEAANLHSNDLPTPALQPQVSKSQVQDPWRVPSGLAGPVKQPVSLLTLK